MLIYLIGGILVTNGVKQYTFRNNLTSSATIASDTNVFINQSVGSTTNKEQTPVLYASSAEYYARRISSLYSVDVILYDTSFNVVGTNFSNAEAIEYKAYASKVFETGKTSYVYTKINGTNHIILFSPLTNADSVYGVCAVIKSMAGADLLVTQTAKIFLYIGTLIILFSGMIFNALYKKMLSPINEITEYNRSVSGGAEQAEKVSYKYEDEISELIASSEEISGKLNLKEYELEMLEEKLQKVISATDSGMIMVDEKGGVLLANQKANAIIGNIPYDEFIPDIRKTLEDVFIKQKSVRTELAKDAKSYVYTVTPVTAAQGIQALIAITDITAIKQLETEQQKFISSVSHELKTPLTTIIGYIDLLQRRGTDDKRLTDKALEVTKGESKRLLRLVNDILNINTYSNLDFDFIFTDVDMDELISETVTEMNVKAEEERKIIVYNSVSLPLISGDYDRLKQVMLNILDNALKYSHQDDLIKVTATYSEDMLEITVRDYGEGIPEEAKSKIFDAFYRVGDDRSRISGGFGLGLSIVKHIIQKHDGDVSIDSVLGQGTLVTVTLPIKEGEINTYDTEQEYETDIEE